MSRWATAILSLILAPPKRTVRGRAGFSEAMPRYFSLPVKKETGYRRETVSHALGGGVSPVGCAEGVVDEDIGESSEGGGEFGVVGFLTGVEAEVFEE